MRLLHKKAVITGGSRGIGKAIALGFAREGATVVIAYKEQKALAEQVVSLIKEAGGSARAVRLDIQDTRSYEIFLTEALSFLGEINILVNNAGILNRASFLELTPEQFDNVINTNFKGTFLFTQILARQMQKQNKGGNIINVSSISDEIAAEGLSHYQATKAAVTMFTKGIALELAKYNIRINTLSPGLTATDINREQRESNSEIWQSRIRQIPLSRAGTPEDHVGAAIFLASDESSWITGARIVIVLCKVNF